MTPTADRHAGHRLARGRAGRRRSSARRSPDHPAPRARAAEPPGCTTRRSSSPFIGVALSAVFLAEQWSTIHDDGPYQAVAAWSRSTASRCSSAWWCSSATLLTLLLSSEYLPRHGIESRPEYVALLLFSATGMLMMTTANDLIVVFVALETLSIPLYVLAAYDRRRRRSLEAGMKYFVLGAFSSAVFLYGIALVYGATGTTSLTGIADFLSTEHAARAGHAARRADAAARRARASRSRRSRSTCGPPTSTRARPPRSPRSWRRPPRPPGSPRCCGSCFTAFGVVPDGLAARRSGRSPILTLLVGSIVALVQTDVKRMLAYSSISHAGLRAHRARGRDPPGPAAALFYLLVYTFMMIGSFAVVTVIGRRDDRHRIDDYRGLATRQPMLAALLRLLPARPGRHPADGRVHRQARCLLRGRESRRRRPKGTVVLAAHRGRHRLGDLRVLLPPGRRDHVLVGGRRPRRRGRRARRQPRRSASTSPPDWCSLVCAVLTLWVGILPTLLLDFARDATLIF